MNRSALITGASRGLGAALARELGARGWSLTIHARDHRRLDAQREILESAGVKVAVAVGDLEQPGVATGLVDQHVEHFGGLDALVANAALAQPAWIEQLSLDEVTTQFTVNLTSTFSLVTAALPALQRSERAGRAILIGSITGHYPIKMLSVYSASKAALRSLGDSINLEYGPRGVRATVVTPGYIDTDLSSGTPVATTTEMLSADDVAAAVGLLVELPDRLVIRELPLARASAPFIER